MDQTVATTMMRRYDSAAAAAAAAALSFIQRTQLIRISLAVWLPARWIGAAWAQQERGGRRYPVGPCSLAAREALNAVSRRCGWVGRGICRRRLLSDIDVISSDVMLSTGCWADTDEGLRAYFAQSDCVNEIGAKFGVSTQSLLYTAL